MPTVRRDLFIKGELIPKINLRGDFMLRLILVRHGQSVADVVGRHEWRADFDLTELGEKQAQIAGKYLATYYGIDYIICSPLKRAQRTAEIIGQKILQRPVEVKELMEMDNGRLAGLTFKEADEKYPITEESKKIYHPIPGGESVIDFRMRIEKFWHRFRDENLNDEVQKTICIVAHGGTISMLYKSILGLPVDTNVKVPTADTGIHVIEVTKEATILLKANSVEHLLIEDKLL